MEADAVPVLLLGFNRPDKVARILEPLRLVKPKLVFAAVDGPRAGREGEAERCKETQLAFDTGIDWPCEVRRLYRDSNLGCRAAVSGAISWALEQVEECLIIEDDCVVEPSFFGLVGDLLDRHRGDESVMNISAANFQGGHRRGSGDYYASKYAHCWGWATWRRAWKHYEDSLDGLREVVADDAAKRLHNTEDEAAYWQIVFKRCEDGSVDSWGYRWMFSCWKHRGVGLIPNVNLVSNVGFGEAGTHTTEGETKLAPLGSLTSHHAPATLEANAEADEYTFRNVFCPPLSHVERQVFQHRIKALKAEIKELKSAKKAEKPQPTGLRRLFGG